jgi:hypothetical protein
MPKSPGEMIAAVKANLPAKTGKSFEQWVKLATRRRASTRQECRDWLMKAHGLGRNTADIIVSEVCQPGGSTVYEDGQALVDAMYAGAKTGLRPIYDALVKAVRKLGPDAELTPCKTYVGARRKRQFALIRPTTPKRVDLGLALSDTEPQGRLEDAKSLGNERIKRIIKIASVGDIDAEVERWLKAAYDGAG